MTAMPPQQRYGEPFEKYLNSKTIHRLRLMGRADTEHLLACPAIKPTIQRRNTQCHGKQQSAAE